MRKINKVSFAASLIGIGAIVNGLVEYARAHPSPHFYIELFVALPQIALGVLMLISSLLILLPVRWVRITGVVAVSVLAAVFAAFYTLYFWALFGNP